MTKPIFVRKVLWENATYRLVGVRADVLDRHPTSALHHIALEERNRNTLDETIWVPVSIWSKTKDHTVELPGDVWRALMTLFAGMEGFLPRETAHDEA